jgi:predicted DNA-binding protein
MTDVRQVLSDQQTESLRKIAAETGITEDDLIREAIDQFIQHANMAEWRKSTAGSGNVA